jgi:hypothetical protein
MSSFIMTPTNIDFLDSVFRDPKTGKWVIPYLTFNTVYQTPYYQIDPLNDDPIYQGRVIDNIYNRLTEKWLYKDPLFRDLLKYFNVQKSGNNVTVSLIDNIQGQNDKVLDETMRNFVYRYIEKYFITRSFVAKVLREYVNTTHIKWYDIYNNIDTVKELMRHKLKKLIKTTIYELQDNLKK